MKQLYLAVAALLVTLTGARSISAYAATACPQHYYNGQEPALLNEKMKPHSQEVCFSEFGVMHSGLTRTPLYSADHLTSSRIMLARQQRRENATAIFHEETALAAPDRSTLGDFKLSRMDRGHLSPNADMDNPIAQGESFSLSNMVPQDPTQNRGIWEAIEETTRSLAVTYGEIWVVTLPVFSGTDTKWLHNRVAIPTLLAKAIYIPSINAAAAYVSQNAANATWKASSIAELESQIGVNIFPAVADAVKATTLSLPAPTSRHHR